MLKGITYALNGGDMGIWGWVTITGELLLIMAFTCYIVYWLYWQMGWKTKDNPYEAKAKRDSEAYEVKRKLSEIG